MAAASPQLVATLLTFSPQLRSLPSPTRLRIAEAGDVTGPGRIRVSGAPSGVNVRAAASTEAKSMGIVPNGAMGSTDGTVDNGFAFVEWDSGIKGWSSVAFLAPEQTAAAPEAAALSPGLYVAKVSDGLNLRSSPEIRADNIITTIPPGGAFTADGQNTNFFAHGTFEGKAGWASAHYLTPAVEVVSTGSGLVLSTADLLQVRAMLAAWANATPLAPPYGNSADMAIDANAALRQGVELAAFQRWANENMGKALRTDGTLDAPTRDALVEWSQRAVQTAITTTDPATTPTGLPTIPPAQPVLASSDDKATQSEGSGGGGAALLVIGGLAALAFFLLEEKRKRAAA